MYGVYSTYQKRFILLFDDYEVLEGRGEASPTLCSEGYDSAQESGRTNIFLSELIDRLVRDPDSDPSFQDISNPDPDTDPFRIRHQF